MNIASNKRAVVTVICFMRGAPTPRPGNTIAIDAIYAMNRWRFWSGRDNKGAKS